MTRKLLSLDNATGETTTTGSQPEPGLGSHEHAGSDKPNLDMPPAYENAVRSPSTSPAPSPQPVDNHSQSQQEPATGSSIPRAVAAARHCTFTNYYGKAGWETLELWMRPSLVGPLHGLPWVASMLVACNDMPRLMRDGFFWSADNILPEEGSICHVLKPSWTTAGFRHARTWILADKSNRDEDGNPSSVPRWIASLEILAPDLALLSRFPMHMLRSDRVCRATAWDASRRPIYYYDWRWPTSAYNCIYDDMPLDGWWPWPKERASRWTTWSGCVVQ